MVALASAGLPDAALPLSSCISDRWCFTGLCVARYSAFYTIKSSCEYTTLFLFFRVSWRRAVGLSECNTAGRHQRWRRGNKPVGGEVKGRESGRKCRSTETPPLHLLCFVWAEGQGGVESGQLGINKNLTSSIKWPNYSFHCEQNTKRNVFFTTKV